MPYLRAVTNLIIFFHTNGTAGAVIKSNTTGYHRKKGGCHESHSQCTDRNDSLRFSALAASGAAADEGGFLAPLFLAFGAAIIAFQAIPAVMLLGSMVKGFFSKKAEAGANAR